MTWFDIAILAVVALLGIRGYQRGLVRQLFDVAGTALAILLAYRFFRDLAVQIAQRVSIPLALAEVIAFALIVIGVAMLTGLAGGLASKAVHVTGIGFLDGLGGAGFGLIKGFLVVTVVLVILAAIPLVPVSATLAASDVAQWMMGATPALYHAIREWLPAEMPQIPWGQSSAESVDASDPTPPSGQAAPPPAPVSRR